MEKTTLQKQVRKLNPEQFEFIENELHITKDMLLKMSEDKLEDVYYEISYIEVDEDYDAGDNPISKRGDMAADIVTLLGRAFDDEDDDYNEEDWT